MAARRRSKAILLVKLHSQLLSRTDRNTMRYSLRLLIVVFMLLAIGAYFFHVDLRMQQIKELRQGLKLAQALYELSDGNDDWFSGPRAAKALQVGQTVTTLRPLETEFACQAFTQLDLLPDIIYGLQLGASMGPESLERFPDKMPLRALDLSGNGKALPALRHASFPQLRYCDGSFCDLCDEDVEAFTGLEFLETLILDGNLLTDNCIRDLKRCRNLKRVFLAGTEVTQEAVERWQGEAGAELTVYLDGLDPIAACDYREAHFAIESEAKTRIDAIWLLAQSGDQHGAYLAKLVDSRWALAIYDDPLHMTMETNHNLRNAVWQPYGSPLRRSTG